MSATQKHILSQRREGRKGKNYQSPVKWKKFNRVNIAETSSMLWLMAYTISKSGCLMEAFGFAVVHDKSGALEMDNPAEIKYLFFVNFACLMNCRSLSGQRISDL